MHGTFPDLIGPATISPAPPQTRDIALRWLVRAALAAAGLGLGFVGGLVLALGTGLMDLC
ncbi:MAG TPA: hypothetical protein VHL98_02980 [Microvirga sp.]|jgi:hypothetical protein|nr:hypothetical protein [Microvirga sp.]